MAKFKYNMNDREAILELKRAIAGKMPILKDNGKELVVGSPMMTVKVQFGNGIVETKASLLGKTLISSVDTSLELIDGFEKIL